MKIPTTIITGYLGSGKTTLLQKIMDQSKEKIAIIMNEFGEIAIDNQIVKGKNIDMVELSGGCVCCSLTGEFQEAVKEIKEKINPDMIVIETTGVAEADALVLDIEEFKEIKLDTIITIIDADALVRFPEIGQVGRSQIEQADIILFNKIDLIKESQIPKIESIINKINKRAVFLRAVKCDIDTNILFSAKRKHKITLKKEHYHTDIESFTFTSDKIFDKDKIIKVIEKFPKNLYRIKGFINTNKGNYLLNYVAQRYDLDKAKKKKTEVVFIGRNAKKHKKTIEKKLENAIQIF